jgi:hypothetical protein
MAHPELLAPGTDELLITYATNAVAFDNLFVEPGRSTVYWPRVVRVPMADMD